MANSNATPAPDNIGVLTANFTTVPIDSLVVYEYNPPSRTDPQKFQKLKRDIKEVGLVRALDVYELEDGGYKIVDGNTRYSALKALDYQGEISVLIHDQARAAAIFGSGNSLMKVHNGNNKAYILLKAPHMLPERERKAGLKLMDKFDLETQKNIVLRDGKGLNIFRKIAAYYGRFGGEDITCSLKDFGQIVSEKRAYSVIEDGLKTEWDKDKGKYFDRILTYVSGSKNEEDQVETGFNPSTSEGSETPATKLETLEAELS